MAMPIEMVYTNTVPVESELEYPSTRPAPVSLNHRILAPSWLTTLQSDDKFQLAAEQGRMPPQTGHQMPPPAYTSTSTYNSDTRTSRPSYASEYTSSPVAVSSFSPISSTLMSDAQRYPESVSEMTTSTNATARGYVMSDEERYPTVVEGPEIHQAPEFHSSSNSVTMLHPPTPPEREPMSPSSRVLYSSDKEVTQKERRKYCGLSRTTLLCIIAAVLLVIIGLSVGLGLWAKSKNKTKRLPAITSSGVWTDTNQTHWFSQIYSTNRTTGQVMFSLSEEPGTYIPAKTMNLTLMPEIDAPMAAVAKWGSDALVYLNLFYIKDQYIVTANVSCVGMSCTTLSNEIIQKNLTYPIADDSGLSAVYLTEIGAYKVFYHNTDRYITELTSEGGGNWDHGDVLSAGKNMAGSKIAATTIGTTGIMHIIYVDGPSKTLYQIHNQDNRWRNRKFEIQINLSTKLTYIQATPVADNISKWDPTTSFTSTYVPKLDSLRCYFVGSDRLIYEFTGKNASTSTFAELARGDIQPNSTTGISTPGWKQQTYHDLTWLKSDSVGAEITSTSWDDQIRYYRLVEKNLAVSTFKDGVWSAKLV